MPGVLMLILRGSDNHGSGHYKASRGDRDHNGIDISAAPGATVCPQIEGRVTKIGWPYAAEGMQHFRYIQITDSQGNAHRLFYVAPSVAVGDLIDTSSKVGQVQDRAGLSRGMGNHVHYEIIDATGKFIDPMKFLA